MRWSMDKFGLYQVQELPPEEYLGGDPEEEEKEE